jgi:hypothetical protein
MGIDLVVGTWFSGEYIDYFFFFMIDSQEAGCIFSCKFGETTRCHKISEEDFITYFVTPILILFSNFIT